MEPDKQRSRFVVLRHEVGGSLSRTSDVHFDWMFEVGEILRTWATPPVANLDQTLDIECDALADHRLAYLDYEGQIEGDRGRVIRILSGEIRLLSSSDDRFAAELFWGHDAERREARLTCYRSLPGEGSRLDESCCWRLLFSPGR